MSSAAAGSAAVWAGGGAASGPASAQAALDERRSDPRAVRADDLSREVYCVCGMPIDAIEMPAALRTIEAAAAGAVPFVISTPNLNFVVNTQFDPDFRETMLLSDLCPVDGTPLVWIARLIGVPIRQRVAGSDMFDALAARPPAGEPLRVCLFGGAEGAAAAAARTINAKAGGVNCVASIDPGYGSVDELSRDDIMDEINASRADILVVALGAHKGQIWLQRNHHRLRIPVRTHLGAVINFHAGLVKRAPPFMKPLGLEWLWRIKEEPYLWRRYWHDSTVVLRLLLTHVLPLAVAAWAQQRRSAREQEELVIRQAEVDDAVVLRLAGAATARTVEKAIAAFRAAVTTKRQIIVDFSHTRTIDSRFIGLLLMLRKHLAGQGTRPRFIGVSRGVERMFRLNGAEFLLIRERAA